MSGKSPVVPLSLILSQIGNMQLILSRKTDLKAFFKMKAESLSADDLSALFDDIFAFNAYLGRIEGYASFDKIPYWEYSTCLEWAESHILSGDSFDLSLRNAKRFLGSLLVYFNYLKDMGKLKNSDDLEKAIKEICGGKRLKLVTDIPFAGDETYTAIHQGGEEIRFDVADYWILILHATLFADKWTKVLEAALGVSTARVKKVRTLKQKLEKLGMSRLQDIVYADVTRPEAERAEAWFFDTSR